uniref:Multidrug export protein MepA n=1 Tax=uncultured bacterium Contig140 TaxID=1393424 RepID=W0FGI6_9BACT|nr:Na+-driven multidrug efflux pump NorM [uncultured bacterium Contig140]
MSDLWKYLSDEKKTGKKEIYKIEAETDSSVKRTSPGGRKMAKEKKVSNTNEEMLRSGPFRTLVGRLCVPAVLIMLVMVLYHMADVFFIGQTGDPNKVAAVTLASPMFSILSGLGVLLGNGGCTAISLALGKGEYGRIRKISAFSVWGAIAIGLVFLGVVLPLMNPICSLLGANEETRGFTAEYLRVIAIGAPVIMLTNVVPALIRADGSTTDSMIGNMLGTVLNIALDPLLISVLGMGVSGAAIATVAANAVSLCYYIYFLRTKGKIYSASPKDLSLKKDVIRPVISLGLPMSCATVLGSVSGTIVNNLMMQYGSVAVAGQSVASRIGQLISMTVMGICMGMQPAISFNYSSKNHKRLTEILAKTTGLAVIAGTVLSLLCLLFRDPLLNAFLDNPEVLEIGRVCLLASIVIGPFLGFYQICTTYLQASGKSKQAILVSLLEKGIVYIPVLFLMSWLFGMYGIIFAATVTTVISAVAALWFCYKDYRKELKQVKEW